MNTEQQKLYIRTKERLRRLGKENPADVIVALAEEIEYYRKKIRAVEELLDHKTNERTNQMSLSEELRNKQSRDNRDLLDRAADRIDELEAILCKQNEGKWERRTFIFFDSEMVGFRCSKCNTTWDTATNYCPNCGAKKKGATDERAD